MHTKDIFTPVYRQDYFEGYSDGSNPYIRINGRKESKAYKNGFASGRSDYESMNGQVKYGIPTRLVTNKVLDDILLAGLLGLSVDSEGYTPFQMAVLSQWYQSGTEKYDPRQSTYLLALLEKNNIEVLKTYTGNLEY